MKLETFNDVLASINRNPKRPFHLLLGNGFSVAYDPKIFPTMRCMILFLT